MNANLLNSYFNSAKQVPLAMSFSDVEQLVNIKGSIGNGNSSWWNLNGFVMLSVGVVALLGIATLGHYNSSPEGSPDPKMGWLFSPLVVEETQIEEKETEPAQVDGIEGQKEDTKVTSSIEEVIESSKPEKQKPEISNSTPEVQATQLESTSSERKQVQEIEAKKAAWWPISNKSKLEVSENLPVLEASIDTSKKEDAEKIKGQSKTITRELSVEDIEWFVLKQSMGEIEIITWDKPLIQLVSEVTIEAKDKELEKEALDDFDLELKKEKKEAVVISKWDKFSEGNCTCFNSRSKIKTENGEKIKLKKIRVNHTVRLPKDLNLNLKNSYGDIEIPDFSGKINARLFQGDINAGNLLGELTLSEKYGDANIKSFKKGEVYLFQGNANLGTSERMDLTAKYSKVNIEKCNQVELSSFQSTLNISNSLGWLDGKASYSNLDINSGADSLDLILFQSEFESTKIGALKLSSSYSQFKVDEVGYLVFTKSFQDKYELGKIGTIKGKTQYSKFAIEQVTDSIEMQLFQGKLNVDYIAHSFKKVSIDGKYTTVSLKVDPESKYTFDAETLYSSINYPSNGFEVKYTRQVNQSLDLKGIYNDATADNNSSISIKSFQGNINLK